MLSEWRTRRILLRKKTKARFIPLFLMDLHALMLDVMLEFFNMFLIKGADIYFEQKDKVCVINKQLIVDVFRMRVDGYLE